MSWKHITHLIRPERDVNRQTKRPRPDSPNGVCLLLTAYCVLPSTASLVPHDIKDSPDYGAKDLVLAIRVLPVLIPAVVAILISTLEAFAEIVAVFIHPDVIRVITVARVLIAVGVLVIKSPSVLTVRLSGIIAFLVAAVHGILKHLRSVLTRVVIITTAIVAVIVYQIVVIASLLKSQLVLTDPVPITLLVTEVSLATFALKRLLSLSFKSLPVTPAVVVLLQTLLAKLLLLLPIVGLVLPVPHAGVPVADRALSLLLLHLLLSLILDLTTLLLLQHLLLLLLLTLVLNLTALLLLPHLLLLLLALLVLDLTTLLLLYDLLLAVVLNLTTLLLLQHLLLLLLTLLILDLATLLLQHLLLLTLILNLATLLLLLLLLFLLNLLLCCPLLTDLLLLRRTLCISLLSLSRLLILLIRFCIAPLLRCR